MSMFALAPRIVANLAVVFLFAIPGESRAQDEDVRKEYQATFASMRRYWEPLAPCEVEFGYNPTSRGLNSLRAKIVLQIDKESVTCYFVDDRFRIRFSESSIVAADENMRTVVSLPPIRLRDGGTTTGIPAELMVCRVLAALSAVPKIKELASTSKSQLLSSTSKRQVALALYPEGAGDELTGRGVKLEQPITNIGSSLRISDGDAILFQISQLPSSEQTVRDLEKAFGWCQTIAEKAPGPMPRLRDWTKDLKAVGVEVENGNVTCFTKSGPLLEAEIQNWDSVISQQARLTTKEPGVTLILSISRSGLDRSRRIEFITSQSGNNIGVIGHHVDYPNARLIGLTGSDWTVSISSNQQITRTRSEDLVLEACKRILVATQEASDK